jgi:hypothetical protein
MPRSPLRPFLCPDKVLERGLNVLVAEINRLNRMTSDGRIGLANDEAGPRWWLADAGGGGGAPVRARIGPAGMTARTGTAPTFTCGEGLVTRYTFDGPTRTLGTATETAYNDHPVTVDGDRDAWLSEIDGNLYVMIENCTAT